MNAALRGTLGTTALDTTVLTIGSSPDNQLVIDDPKVSAYHAEIRPEDSRYSITDLGSIHGTYVNSQRLDWNTAHLLDPGSSITIGDSTFKYEEGGTGPLVSSSNGTIGTAEMPAGAPGLEENADYASPQSYEQPSPTQPVPGLAAPYPGYATSTPVSALPARRSRRRWLWIGLIIVVILGIAGGAAIVFFTRATPDKTLDTYCNALRGQDYNSAYNMLSSSLRSASTGAEFAAKQQAVGRTTICTHDSANVTGNEATSNLTLVSGGLSYAGIISLTSINGDWKISVLLSSPQLTLTIFCNSLRAGDTHTAYNEYSQGLKNSNSEATFAQTFRGVTCIFSSVNASGNSGTANIVFVNSSGPSTPYVVLLIQDPASNSDWRIDGIQAA
ncbi:MAG: FHA domain-containing protein [Ktedonobacteraceae bacterium]